MMHISDRAIGQWAWQGLIASLFVAISLPGLAASQDDDSCQRRAACYVKTHRLPQAACQQQMEKPRAFAHRWTGTQTDALFQRITWYDALHHIVQAFGDRAVAINSLKMETPLRYYCIFNADNGQVVAAAFE